jgi:hypothetical protein
MFTTEEIDLLVACMSTVSTSDTVFHTALGKTDEGAKALYGLTTSLKSDDGIKDYLNDQQVMLIKKRKVLCELIAKVYKIQDHLANVETSDAVKRLIDDIEKS